MSGKKVYTAAQKKAYAKKLAARKPKVLKGRGAYGFDAMVRSAGAISRNPMVRRIAKDVSKVTGLDKYVKMFKGHGSYAINRNSLVSSTLAQQVPMMHRSGESVRVQHREYIQDIYGYTSAFNLVQIPINPALNSSFPWLSSIAQNFTEYRILGLVYEFKSESGPVTTASNQGYVCGAVNYDSILPTWIQKTQIENGTFSASGKPENDLMIPVECAAKFNPLTTLYCRTGAIPTSGNQDFFDLGVLNIATGNQPTNAVEIGELWATYDIELFNPILDGVVGAANDTSHYSILTFNNTSPLLTSIKRFDSIGITLAANLITIPIGSIGTYMLTMFWAGATGVTVSYPSITLSNLTAFNTFENASASNVTAPQASLASTAQAVSMLVFTVNDSSKIATITLGTCVLPTTTQSGDLYLVQLNSGIV